MTGTVELVYVGRLPRGVLCLPSRRVRFTAGCPVTFTTEEAELLETDTWSGPRLPVLAAGPLGRIDEVMAMATTPQAATQLLERERAGKNRPTLVARLAELTATPASVHPNPRRP